MRSCLALILPILLMLNGVAGAQESTARRQGTGANSSDTSRTLIIGVRSDAPPFSYRFTGEASDRPRLTAKSGPIRSQGFDGYMVYICDEVLKQMLIPEGSAPVIDELGEIEIKDVDQLMMNSKGSDRLTLLEDGTIDILCDPATISRDRVRAFASSPPLFLSGVGYLIQRGGVEPADICQTKKALIGMVGTTNAAQYGLRAILASGSWTRKREHIETALRNLNNTKFEEPCGKDHEGAIWLGSSHMEVATAFCEGLITYYVGDLEIIQDSIGRIPGCEASSGVQRFTADRYAVFANMNYDEYDSWKALRIARFFEILNREVIVSESLLDQAFAATFGGAQPSDQLDLFYWSMRGAP